jgi:hypothetical protein
MNNKALIATAIAVLAVVLLGAWFLGQGPAAPEGNTPVATSTTDGTPTSTPISGGTSRVKIAVIKIEDGGKTGEKVGCNDSVVYLDRTVATTSQTLTAAYKELFAWKAPTLPEAGALYTVVPSTHLAFDHATVASGTAKVYLTGDTGGLGGVCDTPRLPAQIEKTALQFSTVSRVETYLNGKRLDWAAWAREDATGP